MHTGTAIHVISQARTRIIHSIPIDHESISIDTNEVLSRLGPEFHTDPCSG